MRPLDEVLQDLADQDERMATDDLIARIEQRLAEPDEVPVVASDRRSEVDAGEGSASSGRRRWIPAVVAAGAALLVLIAVGLPILLLNGGDSIVVEEPTPTAASVTTVTTMPGSFPALTADEMVRIVDLPAGVDWAMEPGGGIRLGWCTGEPLQDPVNEQPLADLSARATVRYSSGAAGIEQALFADEPATVHAAFAEIRRQALACINDPTQWAPPQVDGQIIGQSELLTGPLGDARFAIRSTAIVSDGRAESHVAVVLNGNRLIVVQRDEAFGAGEHPDAAGRSDFWSVVDAAVSRSVGVSTVAEPADHEMLTTGDLPEHSDWQVFDETRGADSLAGWGASNHGVLAVRCDEGLTAWRLDPSPRSYDSDKPWVRLDNARFRAMYTDKAVFGEALYSAAPVAVTEAFDMMKTVTLGCLASPLSAADQADLLAMRQVGGDSIAPDIEMSAADEAELLAIPPVGDDSIAIKVKFYLNRSQTVYDIFHLAVIRDGKRLLIVEEHETVRPSDDPPRVTDAEFAAVVQSAVNRIDEDR